MAKNESSKEEVFHDVDWSVADPIFDYQEVGGPLILAVLRGDLDRVKRLVESGFSINTVNNQGNTPLHLAVWLNNKRMFDYILTIEHVQINAKNVVRLTPLTYAFTPGCSKSRYFAERLLEKGAFQDNCTLLHEVDDVKLALLLVKRNFDINTLDRWGRTPLHVACGRGNFEMACMFLYYGADSNTICLRGMQPFTAALSTCPRFLQDILFDTTFDENGENVIFLHTFTRAIQNSYSLEKMLQKSFRIHFDRSSLLSFATNFDKLSFKHFKRIVHQCPNLVKELAGAVEIYSIFKNEDVLDYLEFFCRRTNFFDSFKISYLFSISNDLSTDQPPRHVLNDIILVLLSYGIEFRLRDLELIYAREKFSSFFETLLHMEVSGGMVETQDPSDAEVIYNVLSYPRCSERHSSALSLIDISRNVARNHIVSYYNLVNCGQFIAVVKRLNIPRIY